jgi:hypothetical protein
MHWTLKGGGFESLPPTQKYFALGEALAHLNYLKEEGQILVTEIDGIFYYNLR